MQREKGRNTEHYNKVAEGQVPAMPPDLFVNYQKPKRQIRAKKFDNCVTSNIVTSSVILKCCTKKIIQKLISILIALDFLFPGM
jgi:hypothetical protein